MTTPRQMFAAFCHCSRRNDGEAFAALCTDDVVLEFPFAHVRFRGRADVRDRAAFAWLDPRRRDVAFERVRLVEALSMLVAEYELVGYVGAEPFRLDVVLLLETREGKISALRAYYDPSASTAAQLVP